jgi:hypothetical protein
MMYGHRYLISMCLGHQKDLFTFLIKAEIHFFVSIELVQLCNQGNHHKPTECKNPNVLYADNIAKMKF